jgi:hypothetical protein
VTQGKELLPSKYKDTRIQPPVPLPQKIFKRILENEIQQHARKTKRRDQTDFIPGLQGWFDMSKSINVMRHACRMKDKNYTIISIEFDKIQHLFVMKALTKSGGEALHRSRVKAVYDRPAASITPHGEAESFSLQDLV